MEMAMALAARILLRAGVLLATLAAASAAVAGSTLLVIGDTGDCETPGAARVSAAMRALPDWQSATLIEVGDLAYPEATRARLDECHEPHFGMFSRRLAVPGNHDWRDRKGSGFFSLFPQPVPRAVALDQRWQVWLLNSNLRGDEWDAQLRWLDEQLKNGREACVIAVWHHPRWSSGKHGDNAFAGPLWERLAGVASFTLHGHDHHYESQPRMDAAGEAAARGTRAFIVGNGGAGLYPPGRARDSKAVFGQWGFLRIDLDGDAYRWAAYNVAGEIIDHGEDRCLAGEQSRQR